MDTEMAKKIKGASWFILIAVAAVIVILWAATPYMVHIYLGGSDYGKFGQFGDIFGSINALFSGLAFAGVFYAIYLQEKELTATQEALNDQKIDSRRQNEILTQQAFDSTFFQLLKLHGDIVMAMELRGPPTGEIVARGRSCFLNLQDEFRRMWNSSQLSKSTSNSEEEEDLIATIYSEFYSNQEHVVGHYFRSLIYILVFVDESSVENKRRYTNVIRAQLSQNEIVLLFYNAISSVGSGKLKPLIEKYSLLKSINIKDLMKAEEHRALYSESAYR